MRDNKILTQEVLLTRGCIVQQGCHLCNAPTLDTTYHIMWAYPYALIFWHGLLAHYSIRFMSWGQIRDNWDLTQSNISITAREQNNVVWTVGVWALWWKRNRRFFSNKNKPVAILILLFGSRGVEYGMGGLWDMVHPIAPLSQQLRLARFLHSGIASDWF